MGALACSMTFGLHCLALAALKCECSGIMQLHQQATRIWCQAPSGAGTWLVWQQPKVAHSPVMLHSPGTVLCAGDDMVMVGRCSQAWQHEDVRSTHALLGTMKYDVLLSKNVPHTNLGLLRHGATVGNNSTCGVHRSEQDHVSGADREDEVQVLDSCALHE